MERGAFSESLRWFSRQPDWRATTRQTRKRRQNYFYLFSARRYSIPRLCALLRVERRSAHAHAQPGDGTGAAQNQREQHRARRDRDAYQPGGVRESGGAEESSVRNSVGTVWQAGGG